MSVSGVAAKALGRVVVVTAIACLGSGCVVVRWEQSDPRLVRGERAKRPEVTGAGDQEMAPESWRKESKVSLEKNIGEPYPDLTLIDSRGRVVRLSSFRGRRVAVLAAIASFVTTNKWLDDLAEGHWQPPNGFDELVVLVSHGGDRAWRKRVKSCPRAYLVGWPLEGFVAQWNRYPTMYAISADGLFEGYWSYWHETEVRGVQSNNPLNLPVTPLACARVAPAG